ncbi:Transglutaminase domain protein [Candidatus Filomicrobium marinum]|uniref:Transglutaminase domain protein n=2 Tax=Filomicrobium TaxID=119044 RepID=A0A0D6JGA4_9HYPH|nr:MULTISPECIES: transglutaminase family protein [Filomicrobium]MCV0369835.1 transglutaminase family protein [Filomicrobium sp.]CFX51566.1 Transglutaminase domain protein [Candidatus Filomicrobium marinum]CPR20113.1 Transglutaminase domain protein [Candidatus Filomicrobium marinum]SDP10450.1 Transglutaminase-like enzyme, putative cysteine protease [Filomicrobium insigne]
MKFDVSHKTVYNYSAMVSHSSHCVHLTPRPIARQTVERHSLMIEPAPTTRIDRIDYFGNPVSILSIDGAHSEFVVHARSTIVAEPPEPVDPEATCAWEDVQQRVTTGNGDLDLDVIQYLSPSRLTQPIPAILTYARPSFPERRPAIAAAWDLAQRIFQDFKFDATATDLSTPLSEVLRNRRGVCQDFSHLMLSCLRAMHLPARYVSGYILTKPPEGGERLQGADASHAWVSIWAPECGWVDMDPTNKIMPGEEHITIAYGRDYDDVCPISGVLLGGREHGVRVAVDVVPTS